MIVTERLDGIPVSNDVREIQREESLLHIWPDPDIPAPMKIWKKYERLGVMHLPLKHVPGEFRPPRGIFESNYIHVEYQAMNGRQPFYHRNTHVEEITNHADGKRDVLTELGTVSLEVGDLSRIPIGCAHDNHAERDVHIIFYAPDLKESVNPYRSSEYLMPPYEGWKGTQSIEFVTSEMSAIGTDVSTFYTEEQLLLDNAKTSSERMQVVKSSGDKGVEWLYKSPNIWLGFNLLGPDNGSVYTRHRMADEVQIQISGKRWLVTQRGSVEMHPGDSVSIPLGCAFTSITQEDCKYLTLLMRHPAEAKMPFEKVAEETTSELVAAARQGHS